MHRLDAASLWSDTHTPRSTPSSQAQTAQASVQGHRQAHTWTLGDRHSSNKNRPPPPAVLTIVCPVYPLPGGPPKLGEIFSNSRGQWEPQAWSLPPPLLSPKMLESLNFCFQFSFPFLERRLSRFSSAICQHLRTPRGSGGWLRWGGGRGRFPGARACLLPAGKGCLTPW